jgi:hypothetical protein
MSGLLFRLSSQVAVEYFEDGALVLRLTDRNLIELNLTAQDVLSRTDGKLTASQVAAELAEDYQVPEAEVTKDVLALYQHLVDLSIVEPVA